MFFDLASNLLFSVHVGGEAILVIMEMLTHLLTLLERLPFMSFHEAMLELFPGILSLHNLHPLFVHFPIVLLPLFFLFDLCGLLFNSQIHTSCGRCTPDHGIPQASCYFGIFSDGYSGGLAS